MQSKVDQSTLVAALSTAGFKVATDEGWIECCSSVVKAGEPLTIYIDDDEVTVMDEIGHFHFMLSSEELTTSNDRAATLSLADRLLIEFARRGKLRG